MKTEGSYGTKKLAGKIAVRRDTNHGRFFGLFMMMAFLCFISSCDVHQFPEPIDDKPTLPPDPGKPDDPPIPEDPDLHVDLDVKVIYKTSMYLWEHYYDPKIGEVVEAYPEQAVDSDHPGTTDMYEGKLTQGLKQLTAKFYVPGYTTYQRLEEFVTPLSEGYDQTLPVRLMPGDYDVVVWSDFREKDSDSRFYDSSDFNSIKINYTDYSGNTDYHDSYRGRAAFTLGESGGEVEVEMRRPMAKYEFVTTDLSEFLDNETLRRGLSTRASIDDYEVKIFYSTYHPSAYNAMNDWLTDSETGISFNTEVTVTGESEASLGFDYVFINGTDATGVQAMIVVYDKAGNNVAQSVQITVPLKRDHHTLLRGAFLTMNGSGGVGIDPGYNGDHNYFP